MQLVDRPTLPPGQCLINFSSEDKGGFIDLGDRVTVDPRLYVSRQAVIDMGRRFGLPDPDHFAGVIDENLELRAEVEQLREENAQLNRDVEAAEWTLERKFQAKPQKKPGRPKVTA